MANHTAFSVALIGEQMRNAKQLYFQLAKVARKERTTEAYAASSNALKTSKEIEQVFDQTVRQVFKEGEKL